MGVLSTVLLWAGMAGWYTGEEARRLGGEEARRRGGER
jgi:hypothetical protein